jgi:hypothetical protein
MTDQQHGNTKPPKEKRIRLAGGPFVKPSTRQMIMFRAERTGKSIGEIIDEAIERKTK